MFYGKLGKFVLLFRSALFFPVDGCVKLTLFRTGPCMAVYYLSIVLSVIKSDFYGKPNMTKVG